MQRKRQHQIFAFFLLLSGLAAAAFLPANQKVPFEVPLLWPEEQRAFLQDGPGLLLEKDQLDEFLGLGPDGREQFIANFLADPLPETPENEMVDGIERRRALVRRQFLSFNDDRAKMLFLHGTPVQWEIVDCAEAYRPLQIWIYPKLDADKAMAPLPKPKKNQTERDEALRQLDDTKVKDLDQTEPNRSLVFFQPKPREDYKLWFPIDSKRVLYNEEMEYWLDQLAELRRQISRGQRFDLQICKRAQYVDRATGVSGLFGFMEGRPRNEQIGVYLEPPKDLTAWARIAAGGRITLEEPYLFDPKLGKRSYATAMPEDVDPGDPRARAQQIQAPAVTVTNSSIQTGDIVLNPYEDAQEEDAAVVDGLEPLPLTIDANLEVFFPERNGQRMVTRAMITIPPDAPLEAFVEEESDQQELRLNIEGVIERQGRPFDTFRVRYLLPPPEGEIPLALAVDRSLRSGEEFLARFKVTDEISGRSAWLNHGFVVPRNPTPVDEMPEVAEEVIQGLTDELRKRRVSGYDSMILVPPETDVVFGLWRADVLVTGERIQRVVFYLDDEPQMTRRRPPFTAELRLETFPVEQIVRVEGYDEAGELVASDDVVLNQPRGQLQVRIINPPRGRPVEAGPNEIKAEVVVPEEERVVRVTFAVNEDILAEATKPPWEATINVPSTSQLTYITATAELESGQRAEDVRFLNSPDYLEEVDVNLVELYTTVTDKDGLLIRDLVGTDFEILEDGKRQELAKFQLVENLPLTLGLVIDASGSMFDSIGEAQQAAVGFVENIISPRDRVFALGFSDRPILLMPRTTDVGAVTGSIEKLVANGGTSLHDAIVTSLYYYRGIRGRRAMVLLSDGEDTTSSIGFKEALEYAKRSGVAVYSIGLNIGRMDAGVRRKLESLSSETGGRTFFIRGAADLDSVYAEIERELRSQYLLAYSSNQEGGTGTYREVEVKVKKGKLKARTIRGYYS